MAKVILVRHAMPRQDPGTPAREWELDRQGREAARELARRLRSDTYHVVSSTEPKAVQTAQAITENHGGGVTVDERLREVDRPGRWTPNHRQLAAAYVTGTSHDAWESRASVVERFDAAVEEQLSVAGDRQLLVVSHGMAMTCWMVARTGLDDPAGFWRGLWFPDLVVARLPDR